MLVAEVQGGLKSNKIIKLSKLLPYIHILLLPFAVSLCEAGE